MQVPILIIGAGPAGLSAAYELQKKGIPAIVIEAAPSAGASWQKMPTTLHLISPWKDNLLPGDTVENILKPATLLDSPSKDVYADYLNHYTKRNKLKLLVNTKALEVRKSDQGLALVLEDQTTKSQTTMRASVIINATGYFSNPFTPKIPGLENSIIPILHFANYKNPEYVHRLVGEKRNAKILVVGKRISSGQALVALHDYGFQVTLSTRGKVKFMPRKKVLDFLSKVEPTLAKLNTLFGGRFMKAYRPRMLRGRSEELIRQGQVPVLSNIRRIESDLVYFDDGTRDHFDAIVFATGFRPELKHLLGLGIISIDAATGLPKLKSGESTLVKNLFFIGIEGQFDFRSRFIRGLREDASWLAGLIAERMAERYDLKSHTSEVFVHEQS